MYNSGISAAAFIESVRSEADISTDIPAEAWYRWLCAVEQFVYTEIFDEVVCSEVRFGYCADGEYSGTTGKFTGKLSFEFIDVPAECAACEFDDIVRFYIGEREFERSAAASGLVFGDNLYWTDYSGYVRFSAVGEVEGNISVFHRLRPALKTAGTSANVMLPPEFIELAGARLRAEAYKIANEDELAAKWMADYNNHLETLTIWARARNERRYGGR